MRSGKGKKSTGGQREEIGGRESVGKRSDRQVTDRDEFRFPGFSNVVSPWDTKRRGRLRHRLRGMDASACGIVAKILDLNVTERLLASSRLNFHAWNLFK